MHARSVVLGLCALIAAPALAAPNHVLTPGMYEITLRTVSPRATPLRRRTRSRTCSVP